MSKRGTSLSVRVAAGVLEHNNRDFYASNVDPEKVKDNITYKREDLREVYQKLFGEALQKYNAKQTKTRNKIDDYYEHISNSKQEKLFYEAIIQFGDKDTHSVGSRDGENAKQMLDKYMKSFEERNPNLYVFNAVLHMDEATPHLHIDFVPFATNQAKGLETRVSLKRALESQDVHCKNKKYTERQQWAVKEKILMKNLAHEYDYEVINKGIHRAHLSVEEYKSAMREIENLQSHLQQVQVENVNNYSAEDIAAMKNQLYELKQKLQDSETKANSPIVEIEMQSDEKIEDVRETLVANKVVFAETTHGFSVPEYAAPLVSDTIKNSKLANNFGRIRDRVALDIDEAIYFSQDYEKLLENLQAKGYEIKRNKHIAVRPPGAERFVRLRSLGEYYTENALRFRIENREKFQNACHAQTANTFGMEREFNATIGNVIVLFYDKQIQPYKANYSEPYTFRNDYRIAGLLECAKLISDDGVTADNIQSKSADVKTRNAEIYKQLKQLETAQKIRKDLISCGESVYSGGTASDETRAFLKSYNIESSSDIENLQTTFAECESTLQELQSELTDNKAKLRSYDKISSMYEDMKYGNYINKLINEERERLAVRDEREVIE